jgi:hypothetical protein
VNQEGREETGLREQMRRELGVMFSRRHQPIPLRVAKWAVFLAVARRLYGTRWFRAWAFGLPTMGLGAHFFYRYMTRGWTEPWGGWNDVEAARPHLVSDRGGVPLAVALTAANVHDSKVLEETLDVTPPIRKPSRGRPRKAL